MKTNLINQIVLSCSLVLLLVNTAWGAVPTGALNTYVTAPGGSLDPDISFSLTMGVMAPVSFSDQSVGTYYGHYYIPNELEYLFASSPNCGKLSGIKQVSCVLYTLSANQTVPSDNAASYQLQFKLKDPRAFCAGSTGIKTINAGLLTILSQASFTPGTSNININCAVLDSVAPANTNVDLVASYDIRPAARVENNNSFPVRIRVYNAYATALEIDNVSARIQVPTAFEAVSLATGCSINSSNLVTCNIGNLASATTKDFQFKLKSSSTCLAAAGNHTFSLSASSSGALAGKPRTEVNSSNNTNIGAVTVVACPTGGGGGGTPSASSVEFKVLSSAIALASPSGDMGTGGGGKYSGFLDYRITLTNTTSQNISLHKFRYNYNSNHWLNFVTPAITNSCTFLPSQNVTCNTRSLAPGETISQDFRLRIVYPNTVSDRTPFNPTALCEMKMFLDDEQPVSTEQILILDLLSGWTLPRGNFEAKLNTSIIPGLNCASLTYTQP